jgi:hypothetical protein
MTAHGQFSVAVDNVLGAHTYLAALWTGVSGWHASWHAERALELLPPGEREHWLDVIQGAASEIQDWWDEDDA